MLINTRNEIIFNKKITLTPTFVPSPHHYRTSSRNSQDNKDYIESDEWGIPCGNNDKEKDVVYSFQHQLIPFT
jgi:hypothetical protein